MLRATSQDATTVKKRGFKTRWMMWRVCLRRHTGAATAAPAANGTAGVGIAAQVAFVPGP